MRFLLIFFIICVYSFSEDFYKNGDLVVDMPHKLHWQDTQDNVSLLKTHQGAVDYCEELTLSGYADWYLPTKEEYLYIIDKTRQNNPKINSKFEYILPDDYWTSNSRWQNFYRYGYYILFTSGNIYYQNKNNLKYVRCVRENK